MVSAMTKVNIPQNEASQSYLDDEQVQQHWRLLNCTAAGCTEAVLIDRSAKLLVGFFNDPDALTDALRPHTDKHIYIGKNPRPADWADNQFTTRKRANDADIETVCAVVLDVDPANREKGTLGTPEHHEAAIAVATRIATDYSGAVIDSGGGAYV